MPRLVNCIFHKDTNASLALYEEDNRFFCFGCGAKGKLDEIEMDVDYSSTYVPSREHKEDYRDLTEWGYKFFESRKVSPEVVERYGVLELTGRSLMFPVYNELGQTTGYQVRYFDGKIKYQTLPAHGVYPKYASVFNYDDDTTYLVESIIDALSIYSREKIGSHVMLGTNLSYDLLSNLRTEKRKIKIWVDDDADLKGHIFLDRLKHIYGKQVEMIDNGRKPYE